MSKGGDDIETARSQRRKGSRGLLIYDLSEFLNSAFIVIGN